MSAARLVGRRARLAPRRARWNRGCTRAFRRRSASAARVERLRDERARRPVAEGRERAIEHVSREHVDAAARAATNTGSRTRSAARAVRGARDRRRRPISGAPPARRRRSPSPPRRRAPSADRSAGRTSRAARGRLRRARPQPARLRAPLVIELLRASSRTLSRRRSAARRGGASPRPRAPATWRGATASLRVPPASVSHCSAASG